MARGRSLTKVSIWAQTFVIGPQMNWAMSATWDNQITNSSHTGDSPLEPPGESALWVRGVVDEEPSSVLLDISQFAGLHEFPDVANEGDLAVNEAH